MKVCHYFSKGYCKHGNTCRYVHDVVEKEPRVVVLSGRALDKLEIEIVELLKSRGGLPILIAALPMVYRERYGRSLLGDGYLSKTGLSLTRLLALLSRIRVLDGFIALFSVFATLFSVFATLFFDFATLFFVCATLFINNKAKPTF